MMNSMDHERNYRMVLPLGAIFALAAIAASVLFVVYAIEWADKSDEQSTFATDREQSNRYVQTQYSYYATVISLLTLIIFFNGYHLTKM